MSSTPIALVTGAAQGIGLEVCRQLAQRGMRVILSARTMRGAKQAREHLLDEGLDVVARSLDVTSERQIRSTAAWIEREFGRIDVLVNNAFVVLDGQTPGLAIDLKTIQATAKTNLHGPLLLCQLLAPLMRKNRHGRIVNVSTGLAQLLAMGPGDLAYKLSKTGMHVVTRVLSEELCDDNVLVNAVCPGWARTAHGGPLAERTPAEAADTIVWLGTLPDNGPTGGFFRDREQIPW